MVEVDILYISVSPKATLPTKVLYRRYHLARSFYYILYNGLGKE